MKRILSVFTVILTVTLWGGSTSLYAQEAQPLSAEQIEDMVNKIVANAEQDVSAESTAAEQEGHFPTKVCRDQLKEKKASCGENTECQTKAMDDFRYCVKEALRFAPTKNPEEVLSEAEQAFSKATTIEDCNKTLNLRQNCGTNKDCRKKIMDGFNNCGRRLIANEKKSKDAPTETDADKQDKKTITSRLAQKSQGKTNLTADELRKLKLKAEILQLESRIKALQTEIDHSQTKIRIMEEGYKNTQLRELYLRDQKRNQEAQRGLERKKIEASIPESKEKAQSYLAKAQEIGDFRKLPDVLDIRLKVVDLSKDFQEAYKKWLRQYGEKISEAANLPNEINGIIRQIDTHVKTLQQAQAAFQVKEKEKQEVISTFNGYRDAIKMMRDNGVKTKDYSESERILSDVESMQRKAMSKHSKFEQRHKEAIEEINNAKRDIETYIAEVRNVRDGLQAQKANQEAERSKLVTEIQNMTSEVVRLSAEALASNDANLVEARQKAISDIRSQAREKYYSNWLNKKYDKIDDVESMIEKQIESKNNEVLMHLGRVRR